MLAMSTLAQGAKAFELSDRAIDARTQVVTIRGEVDLYDAPDIRRRIDELIDAGKTLQAIDLTEARFVDSTTVGVLLAAVMRLRLHDGRLALACAEPAILEVFKTTGLDQFVAVRATTPQALAALHEGR